MATRYKLETKGRAGSGLLCRATVPFVHGAAAEVAIRVEVSGPDDAPWLIVAGGISANAHVVATDQNATSGWWQSQAETFAPYRVLAIDWLGADGTLDRAIDPADQARALLAVLDHLEIERALAFVGASYGAMVGMHLAAIAPERVGGLLAISAPAAAHPFTSANRALQRQAIELGERSGRAGEGVALARKLAMLGYRTEAEFAGRFAAAPDVRGGRVTVAAEGYLDAQGERHRARMDAVTYRRLSESIDLHRIDPESINVPATFVAVDSDRIVPSADVEWLARNTRDSRMRRLSSDFGHDAFLKEEAAAAFLIREFLNELESKQ